MCYLTDAECKIASLESSLCWTENTTVITDVFKLCRLIKLHRCSPSTCSRNLLVYILYFSNADRQGFLTISTFDVIDFLDGLRVLGQTGQSVYSVCGHSNNTAVLQGLHRATQDFSTICSSKRGRVNGASATQQRHS